MMMSFARSLVAVALACLIGIQAAFGAVALDAKSTADTYAGGATSISSTTLTIGSGTLLVVLLMWGGNNTPTSISVTWNGVSLTQVPGGFTNNGVSAAVGAFYLVNPATGNHTLSASWTGSTSDAMIYGTSWTGANLSGGTTTFPSVQFNTGTANPASATVSTQTGDATVGLFDYVQAINSVNNTQLFIDNSNGTLIGAAANDAIPGAATMSAQLNAAPRAWAAGAFEIAPASAAAATPMRTLLGVGQ